MLVTVLLQLSMGKRTLKKKNAYLCCPGRRREEGGVAMRQGAYKSNRRTHRRNLLLVFRQFHAIATLKDGLLKFRKASIDKIFEES